MSESENPAAVHKDASQEQQKRIIAEHFDALAAAPETGRKVVIGHKLKWSAFGAPASWGHVFTGYLHLHQIGVKKGQSVEGGGD